MISDRLLNLRSVSVARSWALFVAAFLALGVLRYFETEEWKRALMAPLTLTVFIAVAVLMADATEAIRSRRKVGAGFYVLLLGTFMSFLVLWFLGASVKSLVILLLFGIFFFCMLFVFGGIKRRL